ncbi:MAG: hypothetical protein WA810_01380 [Maribacter sp.]
MNNTIKCLLIWVLISSCTKIETNTDPIIGIWKNNVKTATNTNKMVVDSEEWIFNDVYLGRFHGYKNDKVVFLTDFSWSVNDNIYMLSYPGTDFPDEFLEMKDTEDGTMLMRIEGKPFALKQN